MSRSVRYTSSPLLASKTPVLHSRIVVGMLTLGFLVLAGRAAYVQVYANDFFQRQGTVRFARTLELPANRGKILDRNGLILASSVPAASIWAIPEDVEEDKPEVRAQLKELARLLEMPLPTLLSKMAERGQIKGGAVDGPLAMDNAIDMGAAQLRQGRAPRPPDAETARRLRHPDAPARRPWRPLLRAVLGLRLADHGGRGQWSSRLRDGDQPGLCRCRR